MKKILAAIVFTAFWGVGCGNLPSSPTEVNDRPKLFMYNLTDTDRNPAFRVGDSIRLAANVSESDTFQLCYTKASPIGTEFSCNQYVGTGFDPRNGTWHIDYPLVSGYVGKWTQWILVNGRESNHLTYTVGN